jgi:hypothetical protein
VLLFGRCPWRGGFCRALGNFGLTTTASTFKRGLPILRATAGSCAMAARCWVEIRFGAERLRDRANAVAGGSNSLESAPAACLSIPR